MPKSTHAGGVVFRIIQAEPRYLLVRAKKEPGLWVFPKGHIEIGEESEAAALREIREEAGVEGEILTKLVQVDFSSGDEPVIVDFYLVEYRGSVRSAEEREYRWCVYDEAMRLMSFPESEALLEKAHRIVTQRFSV